MSQSRKQPADEGAADVTPEGERDTSAMIKKIQTMFGKQFGIKGREDKLRVVAALAGRAVASSSDLTFPECKAVIDTMEEAGNAPEQPERVARLFAVVNAYEESRLPPGERQDAAEPDADADDEGEPM